MVVCITGQLARTELHNKATNLLLPSYKAGYAIDVVLILSPGHRATNQGVFRPRFDHITDAITFLQRFPVEKVRYDDSPQVEAPFVHPSQGISFIDPHKNLFALNDAKIMCDNGKRLRGVGKRSTLAQERTTFT